MDYSASIVSHPIPEILFSGTNILGVVIHFEYLAMNVGHTDEFNYYIIFMYFTI